MSDDRRDCFNICWDCLRELILKARLRRDERELALRSRNRWEASQRLLSQVEGAFRAPRSPGRQDAARQNPWAAAGRPS